MAVAKADGIKTKPRSLPKSFVFRTQGETSGPLQLLGLSLAAKRQCGDLVLIGSHYL